MSWVGSGTLVAVSSGADVGATSVVATSFSPSDSTSTEVVPPPQANTANEMLNIKTVDINFKMRPAPFKFPKLRLLWL